MGLLKTTVTAVAAAEKIKKSVGPAAKEEKKTVPSQEEAKKVTGTKPPAKNGPVSKQSTTNVSKKGADADETDPIEESLNLRKKAGGITEVVPTDKKAVGAKAGGGVAKPPVKAPAKEESKGAEKKPVADKPKP